jgi:hypothetical protein
MSVAVWVAFFVVTSLFWGWVIFGGGADWLDGSFLGGLLIHFRAPMWSADGIRLFAGLTWLAEAIWFLIGLFEPAARF